MWAQARNIRTYVIAFKAKFIARYGDIQAGSQVNQWMSWARRRADTLDPLIWIEATSSTARFPYLSASAGDFRSCWNEMSRSSQIFPRTCAAIEAGSCVPPVSNRLMYARHLARASFDNVLRNASIGLSPSNVS